MKDLNLFVKIILVGMLIGVLFSGCFVPRNVHQHIFHHHHYKIIKHEQVHHPRMGRELNGPSKYW